MGLGNVRVRRRWAACLAALLFLQAGLPAALAETAPAARASASADGALTARAAPRAPAPAGEALRLGRRVRYSGTGWGLWTPLLFGATRGVEALTMKGASTEDRIDHATKWAANPRFWGAVAADVVSVKAAGALLSALGLASGFAPNLILCFVGFAMFDGVMGGFDQIDWGAMAFQSLVLTGVEVAVASLGLPLGPVLPFLAALAACVMLDSFDGYQGAEDDELYAPVTLAPATASLAATQDGPMPPGGDAREAYRRVLRAASAGNRTDLGAAYLGYREAQTPSPPP